MAEAASVADSLSAAGGDGAGTVIRGEWRVSWAPSDGGLLVRAALAARRYAYQIAGWREAFSVIDIDNARSIRLAERLGAAVVRTIQRETGSKVLIYRHPAPEATQ